MWIIREKLTLKKRKLEEYFRLQYTVKLEPVDDGWIAYHPEFGKGTFIAWGKTSKEALADLKNGREYLIRRYYQKDIPIPEPDFEENKETTK